MLITQLKILALLLVFGILTACVSNSGTFVPDDSYLSANTTDEQVTGVGTEETAGRASENSDNAINISWDASLKSNTIGYYIYHSLEPGKFSENDREYVPDYVLTYQYTAQSSGTHYFKVTSSDGFGNESVHTGECSKNI